MPKPDLAYDSTVIFDVLGEGRTSDYLDLAKKTSHRVKVVLIYGYILLGVSSGLLFLFLVSLTEIDSTARLEALKGEVFWRFFFCIIPFTILGTYIVFKARRIIKAAREQVKMIDSSILYGRKK